MKKNFKTAIPTITLVACVSLGSINAANASGFNQFVGLGDSTLDSGYFRYHSTGDAVLDARVAEAIAAGAHGGFAGNGIMETIILAGKLSLNALPIDGGGTNYANGGSLTSTPSPGNVPLTEQIANYLTSVNGTANPHALYVISSGNNDLAHLADAQLPQESSALATSVRNLQNAGARYLLVPNSFRYANLVSLGGEITESANAAEYYRLVAYNTQRWNDLTAAGVDYIPADLDSVFKYVARNPMNFGFTPSAALATSSPSSVSAILSILTEEQQQTYLFIDGKHLTTAGQTIVADYEYSVLTAPGEISLLAESALQTTLSRTSTIQRQMEAAKTRGMKGVNGWITATTGYLRGETGSHFPDAAGNPLQGTIGADYRTQSNCIVGAALSVGTTSQDFSTGGDYTQNTQVLNFYAGYQNDRFWGNAVAGYDFIENDISRNVQLGRFTDQNQGDADGHSVSFALRGGTDFKIGRFTTGPVIGAIFHEVRIDGFTEHGLTGATSLSFDRQTRDSQISQLGWRGKAELVNWKPFAEVTWNHEWNDDDRTLQTSLTSVNAPAYVSLATPVASDWAVATIGTSYKLNDRTSLWGAFSSSLGSEEYESYGGEIGLRISF